jgi:hypothetical protein
MILDSFNILPEDCTIENYPPLNTDNINELKNNGNISIILQIKELLKKLFQYKFSNTF